MNQHDDDFQECGDRVKVSAKPHPDAELHKPDKLVINVKLLPILRACDDGSPHVIVDRREQVSQESEA